MQPYAALNYIFVGQEDFAESGANSLNLTVDEVDAHSLRGILGGQVARRMEISNGSVRPYHVGDSVILLVGQRGKIKLQTVSHSPVGYAVEAGVLDEVEAMHHQDRHVVSNFIGSPEMRIEVGAPLRLAPAAAGAWIVPPYASPADH